jgi:hypothetical protein
LQNELENELKADPLNPTAIDVRYAEHQMLFRKMAAVRSKMIAENVALLTASQQRKLGEVAEARRLLNFWDDAHLTGLLGGQCVVSPAPPGPELVSYLRLTTDQLSAIAERQRAAAFATAGARKRLAGASADFEKAMTANPLDPRTLGDRAAAKIATQRELAGLYKQLPAENQAALSEPQRRLLNAVAGAEKLIDETADATGRFLEWQPSPPQDLAKLIASFECESQYSSFLP